MLMCLDVGNSQIYCGVFKDDTLILQFRRTSTIRSSSDELGVFLRGALRENSVIPDEIESIDIDTEFDFMTAEFVYKRVYGIQTNKRI